MKEESLRQKKIAKVIQQDLGEMLRISGPTIQAGVMFTVTKVRITADLSLARVFVSLFPSKNPQEVIDKINANGKELRFQLGKKVRHQLRIVPELQFFLDDSLDYIESIDKKLHD